MYTIENRALMLAALLALAIAGPASAQSSDEKSPSGRYYAPQGTTVQQWKTAVDSQWAQLNTDYETLQRYQKWFTRKRKELKNQATTLSQEQDANESARRSWNRRVNPTCQSGETYAACSCRPGVVGKRAKLSEIKDLDRQVKASKILIAVGAQDYQDKVNAFNELSRRTRGNLDIYKKNKAQYEELLRQARGSEKSDSGGLIMDENAPKKP
jgi:hypothetical protein